MISSASAAKRVIFFGTPEFAVPSLQALVEAGLNIVAVVTQPDKPVGRKQILTPPPVKVWAEAHHIPVFQPVKIRTPEFHQWLSDQKADVCVVVAYGKIFPETLLTIPPFGFINVHGSILPELRGASPIQFAILNNLKHTGVTIMKLNAGMDTGPLLHISKIDLPARATFSWLHDQLKELGAQALVPTLKAYLAGQLTPTAQPTKGTVCRLLDRTDGQTTWEAGPEAIDRLWRAFYPFPGVSIEMDGKRVKLIETDFQNGRLLIKKLQPEGKAVMTGSSFARGYHPKVPDWVCFED